MLLKNNSNDRVRCEAVVKIGDEKLLKNLAITSSDETALKCIAKNTNNIEILKIIDSKVPLHKCIRCNSLNYTKSEEYHPDMEGYVITYHCSDCGKDMYKPTGNDFRQLHQYME